MVKTRKIPKTSLLFVKQRLRDCRQRMRCTKMGPHAWRMRVLRFMQTTSEVADFRRRAYVAATWSTLQKDRVRQQRMVVALLRELREERPTLWWPGSPFQKRFRKQTFLDYWRWLSTGETLRCRRLRRLFILKKFIARCRVRLALKNNIQQQIPPENIQLVCSFLFGN